jgi:hypothetical protein
MLLAAQIILIISGALLILNAYFMATGRPNPKKGWPLPCPVVLTLLGIGVILLSIALF